MAELFESSGLLSLAALREHETKRAYAQAEAARARAETEQRARFDAERDAARREQERQRGERAARESAESAAWEERLRLEAAQRSEAERASELSRSVARLEGSLLSEREARRTVELNLAARFFRQRLFTSVAGALCLCSWLGLFALYFGGLRPAAKHELAAARQALLAEQGAHVAAVAGVRREARRVDELSARIESLAGQLRQANAERRTEPPASSAAKQRPGSRPPLLKGATKPCRDDGDPLNPCLRQ